MIQVVKGSLTDEELAAVTAVLLARAAATAAARQSSAAQPEPVARWQRLERRPSYYSPLSWQTAA
ncbi:acyl-CoA carboxylase subunit epsilon [Peterkaempfera bronchialis]|uniref:Acyl-CoA carboxylase subunit epsilon n=1 Tax=Peterkaempfera bronchialis TaxID=2126346 RepID=A0A345SZ17_9ACTN|nr:acyl-CoA carboxylase subunit epsilon [Peterkaempfera bronchialis]AXI78972.1 acyl-CoA carboxylase subunit epsilon [Peterkaempfera bronchialis]